MEKAPSPAHPLSLSPLPYHEAVLDYLQAEDPEVWRWFAATPRLPEQAEAVRLDLLKSAYRLDKESQPRVHALAAEASAALGLDVPVTLYQLQQAGDVNASLAYLPAEVHIVFQGPALRILSDEELRCLVAHELTHHAFLEGAEGRYRLAGEMLEGLAADKAAGVAHAESARLFRLATELYADRGALAVGPDLETTVSMLVKVTTGLESVNASSYLRQAEEIFSKEEVTSEQLSHPEVFIRARSLKLWSEKGSEAEAEIASVLEGPLRLERLDLIGQRKVERTTLRLIDGLLAPVWFRTEAVLAHARMFDAAWSPPQEPPGDSALAEAVKTPDESLRKYYAYVLLDFATVDRSLEDLPLAAALVFSRRIGLEAAFLEAAARELRLRKRQVKKLVSEAEGILDRAGAKP